eukprot:5650932-Pleurochrysis_carterae.AAC.1
MSPVGGRLPFWIGYRLDNEEAPTRMANVFNLQQMMIPLRCSGMECLTRTSRLPTALLEAGSCDAHTEVNVAKLIHGILRCLAV